MMQFTIRSAVEIAAAMLIGAGIVELCLQPQSRYDLAAATSHFQMVIAGAVVGAVALVATKSKAAAQ